MIGQSQTVAKEDRQLRSAEERAAGSVATPLKPSEKVRHVHIPSTTITYLPVALVCIQLYVLLACTKLVLFGNIVASLPVQKI